VFLVRAARRGANVPGAAMRGKDFISIRDFSTDELSHLIASAREIKAAPHRFAHALEGQALALIFEKPSLRTRVSFDVGIQQLGGFSVYLSPQEISLGKRESVHDVAKNLERMVQAIMVRTFAHSVVEELAGAASIPVINGLTDFSHPCQAMADYMTLLEIKGRLRGTKLAFVGDGNNVANSLLFAGTRFGVHVSIASPPGYEPRADVLEWCRANAKATGSRIVVTNDPVEAVREADAVYTDVWASMGQESETAARARVFAPYQVNQSLFEQAGADAVFMHCLPAHRGDEVTADVIDSRCSVVFQQAENRLHAEKAIMFAVIGQVTYANA
jgi:ornithine carbamoyltransferase